jgi:hypothetical protein
VQFTNEQNLPEPLVRAVTNDKYDRGQRTDFSVTQLLGPPRIRVLRKRHSGEIVEDVADRIYALLGQSVHTILERAEIGDALTEVRLYMEIDGLTISGQLDRAAFFKPIGLLQDYKLCSVWASDDKPEWIQQLNLLALILKRNGYQVTQAQIVAIYRDWSKAKAKRERGYPQHQARPIDVELWPEGKTVAFLRERIAMHTEAEWTLPLCTPSDRWERGEEFAVMKAGNKRATSVHPFRDQAEKEIESLLSEAKKKAKFPVFTIEHRPGVNVRCQDYCPVSDFCEQWKELQPPPKEQRTVFDDPVETA